jgi:serine phosphatase RsbU (regulator of sigma subunit)
MIADGGQGAPVAVARTLISQTGRPVEVHVTAWNSPAGGAVAGGDWCEVLRTSEDEIAFTIGDVSGHGESVSDKMESMRASVLHAIHHVRVPSEVLAVANSVAFHGYDNLIVTGIVAVYNQRLQTLTFANAGHPPPLLLVGDRHAFLEHPPADLPLGIFPHFVAANYVIALPRDVLLVFYTDGIIEHDRKPLQGETEIAQAALSAYDLPGHDAAGVIAEGVFKNGRGHDDAAVMALRLRRIFD